MNQPSNSPGKAPSSPVDAPNRFQAYFTPAEIETLSWLLSDYSARFKYSANRRAIGRQLYGEVLVACDNLGIE